MPWSNVTNYLFACPRFVTMTLGILTMTKDGSRLFGSQRF